MPAGSVFRHYQRLFRYLGAYWPGWIGLAVITLLNIPFALLQPWPMQVLVDHVFDGKPVTNSGVAYTLAILPGTGTPHGLLAWAVAAGLVIFFVNSAMDVALTFGWINVGQRMVYDLARDLFGAVQRRSMVFHTRNSVGDLMGRIVFDAWAINSVCDCLLLKPINVVLTLISMTLVMSSIDWKLTLLALAVAPFMAGSSFLMGSRVRLAARASREIVARMQSHVQQTLSGIPVVQAFVQEERAERRFRDFASEAIRAEQRNTVTGSIYNLGSGLIITLGNAVILWLGARQVLAGHLTLGTLLVFLSYLTSLHAQIRALTDIYRTLQQSRTSVDRVMEILEQEQDVPERPGAPAIPPVAGQVILDHVTFGYERGRPSVTDVSIETNPGDTIAIVGPTGAGKSTLVSLVPRFVDPWEGRVLIDGTDARSVQIESLRRHVAVVLQEAFLLPISIAENIAIGRPGATREEIETAARDANAHQFIERLPEQYDTVIGERGATLSGGERQRLSIARALLKNAAILILDEPTSALDASTEALLLEALQRLMRNRTTFIVAHRLSTIRNATRIVVLQHGRLLESGSHHELLRLGGFYAHLHQLQTGSTRDE